jgi:two-component system, OmpR family, sensor histidine kinase KdpD
LTGLLVAVAGLATVVLVLLPFRNDISPATPALLFVVPVGLVAWLGTRVVATGTAVVAAIAFSVFFLPPFGSLRVQVAEDVLALTVFVLVALTVATLVGREADRRRQAEARELQVTQMHAEYQRVVEERERLAVEVQRVAVLEEVDEQRAALLRSVSHDLRTPLATILAVTSGLRNGTPYDDATRDELLDLVIDEVNRLDRVVSNLLSMSRIEAGALQPDLDVINVADVIDHVLVRQQRLLRNHHVRLGLPELPAVCGDATQLDLVLTNLIENAARFAPAGTPIEVRARREGDLVRVTLIDHGPGIGSDIRSRLFEPFASGSDRRTGLGLATCKAIVEAHGGTISAGDTPGGGACFSFTLRSA